MNVRDAAYCSGCGRELGLEPIARDGAPMDCPDCHLPMDPLDCGPGALYDCSRCGGQFVEHGALRDLLEQHDRLGTSERRPQRTAPVDTRVRYVSCPACRALMNRRNFGAGSGVIVDVCSKHGTWFDTGELPRVLAYVESGGLQRSRQAFQQEREKLARERLEQRIAAARLPSEVLVHHEDPLSISAADLLSALLGF
jgi:Zn-finger nucleic acid-binding protein